MWRRWFRGKGGKEIAKGGYALEVLEANWIPPLPQFPVAAVVTAPARVEAPEAGAFLERVYAHQEC